MTSPSALLFGFCFAQGVIQVFQPLFTAADGYIGLAVIYGAMSLFWFVGVHGPSIVQPGIDPIRLANQAENLSRFCWPVVTPPIPSPSTCRSWVSSAAPAPRSSCRFC